jgi:ribonuclease HI
MEARRLQYMAAKHTLIPCQQFGGRAGYSTTDALLSFVNDIQASWNHGLVTSALTFDIKGFFDFVNHDRLISELRRKRIPLQVVKFVKSFLSDRKAAVCIDGIVSDLKDVENGTPQGSPLSPILSAFYAAELLELLECKAQELCPPPPGFDPNDKTTKPNLFMYVDDGELYISSPSLLINTQILHSLWCDVIVPWGKRVGLAFDFDKRELMHYTRRKSDNNISPSMTFHDDDGVTRVVAPQTTVKWLGVYFDRKLLFNHHVKILAGRAGKAVGSLVMLANTVKGLSPHLMRLMYKACVVPVMTYASPVWWTGKKCHEKLLEKIQRRGLRLICAVFRTTPVAALEIEASILPIRIELDRLNRSCGLRFNKLSTTNPIIQRLDDSWRAEKPPTRPPPIHYRKERKGAKDMKRLTQLQIIARHTSSSDERIFPFSTPPWRRVQTDFGNRLRTTSPPAKNKDEEKKKRLKRLVEEHNNKLRNLSNSTSNLCIYTDGSLKPVHRVRKAGAGLVAYYENKEVFARSIGLGSRAEVYDGEIVALSYAAGFASSFSKQKPDITHWQFFSDSSASIQSIFNTSPKPGQLYCSNFYRKTVEFLDADPSHTVEIAWTPSHTGIEGNERADELAKAGTELASEAAWNRSRSNAIRMNKKRSEMEWQKQWADRSVFGRFAIANQIPPSLKPTERLKKTKREVFGRLVQCRTGHAHLGEYYSKFVPTKNIDCPCGEEFQTREHVLRACPWYEQHRHILRKVSADISLSDILGTEKGISALIDFLDITGAFTRDGMKRNPPQDPEYKPRSVWDDFDDITNTQAAEGDPTEADWRDEIVDPDDFENDI